MHSLPEDRTLFEAIPDPAFRLDRHGAILDLNAAARAEAAPGSPRQLPMARKPTMRFALTALPARQILVLIRDITERKLTENALRRERRAVPGAGQQHHRRVLDPLARHEGRFQEQDGMVDDGSRT